MPTTSAEDRPDMLPRSAAGAGTIDLGNAPGACILYPAGDPRYGALAGRLAGQIQRAGGLRPELATVEQVLPQRSSLLPAALRARPLILLGNLGNNRALLPLYARYYCATDAAYPGGDGYDLRTMVNPYGAGANLLLAGGSSFRGVERVVERLGVHLQALAAKDGAQLPFLLEVELEAGLARSLADWPETPLQADVPDSTSGLSKALGASEGLLRAVGAYGSLYAWTGDRRYGDFAARCLKALNEVCTTTYGDWHYLAERFIRALPWLNAGGYLTAGDILRTDRLLLGTALGTQDMWWRMRSGDPPLGHRHQGKGSYEFLLVARYLLEQGRPNPAARQLCARWYGECRRFLDGLSAARIDDQDDESTANNLATLTWYALGEERFDFFESGAARRVAERAIALHDNMGAGAGEGGYAEGQPGAAYYQQEATAPVAAVAFYEQDGGLKWILDHMPNLRVPLRLGFLGFTPVFIHHFASGAELPATRPAGLSGLRVLPVTPYQYEINSHPPEHYEPAGHSVNAKETWMPGEGIGVTRLPRERLFDKLVLRGGFAPEDAYLLVQGYQGGFRWQGHLQAANCIVRFSQGGHIFLVQNTGRHSLYHKNGVFVNDGANDDLLPPFAELLAAGDGPQVAASATRLAGYHGADWTRHIFWSKRGAGFFVVIDTLAVRAAGPYLFTCTWRTPGYARLEGRSWSAEQGERRFRLCSGRALQAFSEAEEEQGAVYPFVLRQRQGGDFQPGEQVAFENLFSVSPREADAALDLRTLGAGQALVTQAGAPLAWCAAGISAGDVALPGVSLNALSAWASAGELLLLAATSFDLPALGWRFACSRPVDLRLDLEGRVLELRSQEAALAEVTLQPGQAVQSVILKAGEPLELALPAPLCEALFTALAEGLAALGNAAAASSAPDAAVGVTDPPAGPAAWTFPDWTRTPERLRDLTLRADPPPLDGFAGQLVDGVLPEMRETWRQWPPAAHYELHLRLAAEKPLDHLRIVGDSDRDPTLHSFHALPEGIRAEVSSDGFASDVRDCPPEPARGALYFKRYRDVTDRMETLEVPLHRRAREIRLRVPAPPVGEPLVLHEIEVYGAERVCPPVTHLLAADLDGDGQTEVVAANSAGELLLLSAGGTLRWRTSLPGPFSHLSLHDLEGRGLLSLCLGLPDGKLLVLSAAGQVCHSLPLAARFREQKDSHFGWLNTINAVAVWRRGADGRAALVIGGYATVAFLDSDLNLIGHSWADGAWQSELLVIPPGGDDPGSLWVRNGWNHGICVYEGLDSFAPSGESLFFGGAQQPMFRALRKVIPFVNGPGLAFQRLDGQRILAAAEMGLGLLSTGKRRWLWKREGGAPLVACVPAVDAAGQDVILSASADGFVTVRDAQNGAPVRRIAVGAPLSGLVALPGAEGGWAIGSRQGLYHLDRSWRLRRRTAGRVRRLAALGDDSVVTVDGEYALERFTF